MTFARKKNWGQCAKWYDFINELNLSKIFTGGIMNSSVAGCYTMQQLCLQIIKSFALNVSKNFY